MQVIGAAGVSQGAKAQQSEIQLHQSIAQKTAANRTDIHCVYVAVALPVVQGIALGGQSHGLVILRQALGVGEHQRAVEVYQRTHAKPQYRVQAAKLLLNLRAFGIGCGKKQYGLTTIKKRSRQGDDIILLDLLFDGGFGVEQAVAPITHV